MTKKLDMEKLSYYYGELSSVFKRKRILSNIQQELKNEYKGLSYPGEIMERCLERNIQNREALFMIALGGLLFSKLEKYPNQEAIFYENIKELNLLGEVPLFDFIFDLFDTFINGNEHDLLSNFKKMSEDEKKYFFEFFIAKKNESLVGPRRKIASILSELETYMKEEANELEKLYLLCILSNSKEKKYNNLNTALRGKKEIADIKTDVLNELLKEYNLTKDELHYLDVINLMFHNDYTKVRLYRTLNRFFIESKNAALIRNLIHLNTKESIGSKMLNASRSSEFLRNISAENMKAENPSFGHVLFYMYIDCVEHLLRNINPDMCKAIMKDGLTEFYYDLFKNTKYFKYIALFCLKYGEKSNNRNLLLQLKKLTTVEYKRLYDSYVALFMYNEDYFNEMNFFVIGMKRKVITKEMISNSFKGNDSTKDFFIKLYQQLIYEENIFKMHEQYIGETEQHWLFETIIYDPTILSNQQIESIREKLIISTIDYIEEEKLHALENFLFTLYSRSDFYSKEMYQDIEESVMFLAEKKDSLGKPLYKKFHDLFVIDANKVREFIDNNSSFYSYSENGTCPSKVEILMKPFLLTKDESVMNALTKAISEMPLSYRSKDRQNGFFLFYEQVIQLPTLSEKNKEIIEKEYLYELSRSNPLFKRQNIKELEYLVNKLKEVNN